jgi:hypothetical protein
VILLTQAYEFFKEQMRVLAIQEPELYHARLNRDHLTRQRKIQADLDAKL